MIQKQWLVFVMLIAVAASEELFSQSLTPQLIIGAQANMVWNHERSDFNFFPQIAECGRFTGGTSGIHWGFSAFADIPFSRSSSFLLGDYPSWFEFNPSLGYQDRSGIMTAKPEYPLVTQANGTPDTVNAEHSMRTGMKAISARALVSWRSPYGVLFSIGPEFSFFPSTPTYEQTEHILSPEGIVYQNGTTIDTLAQGSIPNARRFLPAAVISGSYRFPLSTTLVARAEASASFPLANISSSLSWSVTPFSFGFGLGYILPLPEETLPGISDGRRAPALYASLALRSTDEQGNILSSPTVYLGKTITNEEIALLRAVFFDSAQREIPARYNRERKMTAEESDMEAGAIDTLSHIDALDVAHDVLNIIGARLTKKPDAKIRLVGSSGTAGADANDLLAARARAEAVEKYFRNVWNIDSSRIEISVASLPENPSNPATTYGQEENRRVDIFSDDYEVIKPFVVRSSEKRYVSPPSVTIEPSYHADTTIVAWEILIRNKHEDIVRLRGTTVAELVDGQQSWTIDPNKIHDDDDSVLFVLRLRDAAGQQAECFAALGVRCTWKTNEQHFSTTIENRRIERFNVITFDFDKNSLALLEERTLLHAQRAISTDAILQVTGYTDLVTGPTEYNLRLAGERAQRVSERITDGARAQFNVAPREVVLRNEGPKNLYDNELPEGRFLSRRVGIEIIKPLEVASAK